MQTNFDGWELVEVFDTVPMPGAFVSPDPAHPISVFIGSTERSVTALNFHHAMFRGYTEAVAENGGDLQRCCVCGAHLRYAAIFEDKEKHLFVVGQECAQRVQAGVENREEWQIALALKDAKQVTTKNGPRWTVNFFEPANFRTIPYDARPKYVSTWTPKGPKIRGRQTYGKPRVTIWAATEVELLDNIRAFRTWLKEMNINLAQRVKPRNFR